jgi:hypothetical protein
MKKILDRNKSNQIYLNYIFHVIFVQKRNRKNKIFFYRNPGKKFQNKLIQKILEIII